MRLSQRWLPTVGILVLFGLVAGAGFGAGFLGRSATPNVGAISGTFFGFLEEPGPSSTAAGHPFEGQATSGMGETNQSQAANAPAPNRQRDVVPANGGASPRSPSGPGFVFIPVSRVAPVTNNPEPSPGEAPDAPGSPFPIDVEQTIDTAGVLLEVPTLPDPSGLVSVEVEDADGPVTSIGEDASDPLLNIDAKAP